MNKHQRGFTLIELIIVMIVTSIVVVMISAIISRPLTGYFDTQRRADLADRGQAAINRMAFELENSVPNSVRIIGTVTDTSIEFMPVLDAGRYRSTGAGKLIEKNNSNSEFYTMTSLDIKTFSDTRIVVAPKNYYVDATSSVPDSVSDKITITITTPTDSNRGANLIELLPYPTFAGGSPSKRFYLAKDAVTYHCDLTTKTLMRYQGYTLAAAQPNTVALLTTGGGKQGTLATGVTACTFSLKAPSAAANLPIVIISLEMTADGEKMTLFKEVQLWNAP